MKTPRVNSLVIWKPTTYISGGIHADKHYLFLGEIPNMKNHCSLAEIDTGKVLVGYHTSDFRELTEEET